jgi:hypothetical protein
VGDWELNAPAFGENIIITPTYPANGGDFDVLQFRFRFNTSDWSSWLVATDLEDGTFDTTLGAAVGTYHIQIRSWVGSVASLESDVKDLTVS